MKRISIIAIVAATGLLAACTQQLSQEEIRRNAVISSLNLTPDEQNIWKTLTPEQQNRAIAFIQNGGTLIASLGDA